MITSKSNAKIKNVRKLLESASVRAEKGVFVVEGRKMFSEVPHGSLKEVYISESLCEEFSKEASLLNGDVFFEAVSDDVFKTISDTVTPQGILAVVQSPVYDIKNLLVNAGEECTFVILDEIRDPGNLGTIIRTCEAAGVSGLIMSDGCVDITSPKVVRSTMGSIFRLPFVSLKPEEAVTLLKESGFKIFGASLDAAVDHRSAGYGKKNAFVIGNEANGISAEVLHITDQNIKIPMEGKVESLNAAVSLAILLFGMRH